MIIAIRLFCLFLCMAVMAGLLGTVRVQASTTATARRPTFEVGYQKLFIGDYKTALKMFRDASNSSPDDPESAYYYAYTLHRMGRTTEAANAYKHVLERFPHSAAGKNAYTALSKMAPQYLRQFIASRGEGYVDPDEGVAPDLYGIMRQLPTDHDLKFFNRRGQYIVHANLRGRDIRARLDVTKDESFIGRNHLKDLGAPTNFGMGQEDEGKNLIRLGVRIGSITRVDFPMKIVDHMPDLPLFGKNILRGYTWKIDDKNRVVHLFKLSRWNPADHRNFTQDFFEWPYSVDGPNKIIEVYVENGRHRFIFDTGAAQTTMTRAQLLAFEPNYQEVLPPDVLDPNLAAARNQMDQPGDVVKTEFPFKINNVRVGRIVRKEVMCQVVDLAHARYPSSFYAGQPYPVLGANFFGDWTYELNESKKTVMFKRK